MTCIAVRTASHKNRLEPLIGALRLWPPSIYADVYSQQFQLVKGPLHMGGPTFIEVVSDNTT